MSGNAFLRFVSLPVIAMIGLSPALAKNSFRKKPAQGIYNGLCSYFGR